VLQEARELSIMLDRAHIADAGLLQGFLASAFALNNQFDAGRRNAQQALATCYASNFQSGVWICLTILGQAEHGEGIHKKAYQYHHQALTHAEQHQNLYGTIQSLGDLGCVSWALGNVKETSNYLRRGLSLLRAFFIVDTVLLTILGIAGIYERNGRPKIALELLAILLHHSQSGTPVLGPTLRLLLRRLQSQLSVEQVGKVLEMAKEGRLTSNYIDPQFAISPELVDRLSELLDEAAKI
jgi:tetratricopeptide (TPR) repeat protein